MFRGFGRGLGKVSHNFSTLHPVVIVAPVVIVLVL